MRMGRGVDPIHRLCIFHCSVIDILFIQYSLSRPLFSFIQPLFIVYRRRKRGERESVERKDDEQREEKKGRDRDSERERVEDEGGDERRQEGDKREDEQR